MPITSSGYVKDWRDGAAGNTPVSAAALEDSELRQSLYTDAALASQGVTLNATLSALQSQVSGSLATAVSFGAVGNGTADDTIAIKAAIATGKNLVLPASGQFKCTDELVMNPNQSIISFGADLIWPTDLGAGKYAIRWSSGQGNITGVRLLGPGWFGGLNPSQTPGVSPANMRGALIPAGGKVFDGEAHGFNSGYEFRENNEWFINVRTGGNLVGIRRAAGATGGDQVFENISADRDYLCGIHIDVGATIGAARISTMFHGNMPYGIYAPGGGTAQAMLGCQIVDYGAEGYGNGIMYAGGNRSFSGIDFMRCSDQSGFVGPAIAANTKDAAIHAYAVSFTSDNGFPQGMGDIASIRGDGQVSGTWGEMDNCLFYANLAGKPIVYTGETADSLFGQTAPNRSVEFCRPTSGGTTAGSITAGDVVQYWSDGIKIASTGIPRGVALATNYAGSAVPVARSGMVTCKSTDTALNGAQNYVKVDTANPGTVIKATGPTDGSVIGVNIANVSSGTVKVNLRGLG